jgi:hypothetical protein
VFFGYVVLWSNLFFEVISWVSLSGMALVTESGVEMLYKPGSSVSRQAMAAFVHRLVGDTPSTLTEPFFADVGPSNAFYDDIQWMGESGVSTGTPQSGGKPLYKPSSRVSREAMAAFLHRFALLPGAEVSAEAEAAAGAGPDTRSTAPETADSAPEQGDVSLVPGAEAPSGRVPVP